MRCSRLHLAIGVLTCLLVLAFITGCRDTGQTSTRSSAVSTLSAGSDESAGDVAQYDGSNEQVLSFGKAIDVGGLVVKLEQPVWLSVGGWGVPVTLKDVNNSRSFAYGPEQFKLLIPTGEVVAGSHHGAEELEGTGYTQLGDGSTASSPQASGLVMIIGEHEPGYLIAYEPAFGKSSVFIRVCWK